MQQPGFQSFVAWRYLLERPRRVSAAIVMFIAFAAWLAVSMGATMQWYPLTKLRYMPPPTYPLWLVLFVGFALAASAISVGGVAVQALARAGNRWRGGLSRGGTPRPLVAPLTAMLAAYWAVIALAALGVFQLYRAGHLYNELTYRAVELPGIVSVGWLLFLVVVPISAIVLWPLYRFRRSRVALALLAVDLGLFVMALAAASYGFVRVVFPAVTTAYLLAPLAFGVALTVAALLLSGRAAAVCGFLVTVALFGGSSAGLFWWVERSDIAEMLIPMGGYPAVKWPMWMVISMIIPVAFVVLGAVLAAVRYFFTFFTTVSIGGVAIGTLALVVVLSVMSGFETDLRDKILGSNAHILISRENEMQFTDYRDVAAKVEGAPGVVAQTPYLLSEVVISANGNYANVIIKGIDPETVVSATDLGKNIEDDAAIRRLWPLTDDGKPTGPPDAGVGAAPDRSADGGSGTAADAGAGDDLPPDFNVSDDEPVDLSGGSEPEEGADGNYVLPDDFVVADEEPVDLSGGAMESDAGPTEPLVEGTDLSGSGQLGHIEPEPLEGRAIYLGDDFDIDAEMSDYIPPHVARLPGILVGQELEKQISLFVGQEVKIISPLGEDTPMGTVPRTAQYRVAGTFFTGMYEYDLKSVYVHLTSLQDFLDIGDEVNGIEVRVEDPDETHTTVDALRARLGADYDVRDWKAINRSLFSALKLEKIAMFLVLVIIVLVASFSIAGNLIMVVVEKAKEIAILKTLGASDWGVRMIFVTQGFFIGLVGTVIGVSLGLSVCGLLIRFGFPLDPDVYYIDRLPVHIEPISVTLVVLASLVISVGATWYPATIAARMRPISGLRYE